MHAMGPLMQGFAFLLDQLGFEAIHNKTDVSFLTSDNPVICFDPNVPEASVQPYQVRPPRGSVELLFPVDANTVLRGHTTLRRPGPLSLRHVVLTNRQDAKRINRFVARFGYRFVFSRDSTHEALIAKHANVSPVVKVISLRNPGGGVGIVSSCVFGPRPTKRKWTD
jgi:hypothetical protein